MLIVCTANAVFAQGIITGNIMDDKKKALEGATVEIISFKDSLQIKTALSNKTGEFTFSNISFGLYRLRLSYTGMQSLTIDSINFRTERFDFNLTDITLKPGNSEILGEVIVYAEKPLIQSKDGNITFNAGESALAAGSNASELLNNVPLVSKDPTGKILVRGKEPKILIDDKPVELNAKQLQDLLESMPGSMIEKIEVMTTPPPQYANERGGVINIVTKKGKVGFNGKLNINYGTRGEAAISGNLSYRKNKIAINFSAGYGYSIFNGNSYSNRQNIYTDSSNYFNTVGESHNNSNRPNMRLSLDYDLNKRQSMNFTAQYNSNNSVYENNIGYTNADRYNQVYKLSNRITATNNNSWSPVFNFTYTIKGKNPKTILKFISGFNFNAGNNERDFYQQYLNPDYTPTGSDSTQEQNTYSKNNNTSFRINYDKPLKDKKTSLNFGATYNRYNNHNVLNTAFMKKPENIFVKNEVLSNDFLFHQRIYGLMASVRYDFVPDFYLNGGLLAEYTQTHFDIKNNSNRYLNNYWSMLPFANLVKKWKSDISITFSYKRTVQRPRLNELNPSLDYGDPYNTRSGNPYVQAYYADNFDFIFGKWNKKYNFNVSAGYNALQKIYSSIRTLQPDGSTFTTWQNISGRKEYEASAWGGYTLSKKAKANLSFGYNYNVYSLYDRNVRRFRNGGSFYSTLNGSYQFTTLMNANASFTFNRFANPQGSVRSTLSMNIGVQQKFFAKKITVTFNIIDPFRQQQNKNFTYGSNFNLESYSTTKTRNYRLALSYTFKKKEKKSGREALLKKLQKK